MKTESGQSWELALYDRLVTFDPDPYQGQAIGVLMEAAANAGVPMHRHVRGQLLTTLCGQVSCETADGLWPISSGNALWIPENQMHRSMVSSTAEILIVYFRAATVRLPPTTCFLKLAPLVREMMLHLARIDDDYEPGSRHSRIASLLVDEISEAEIDRLYVPMPNDPKLKKIAYMMLEKPGDRRNIVEWAQFASLSERTLRRQIEKETGMTFGRWCQQFRLALALRELQSGTVIKKVAEKLGYESVAAFSSMFKRYMGRSPGSYNKTSDCQII